MSLFITFEGVEGAGKTTQIRKLAESLRRKGTQTLVTREPGGCPLADDIRQLLLHPGHGEMFSATELFLYLAARAQHVFEVIRPALETGKTVLCDRFADATTVYQGCARGLDIDMIHRFNAFATAGISPDLTILMDMPVEKCPQRLAHRKSKDGNPEDRLELESADFHGRVRQGYLMLARNCPQRFRVVDATKSEEEIAGEILKLTEPFLT